MSFDELLVEVLGDRADTEAHKRPLAERRSPRPQSPQNQVPPPIVLRRVDGVRVPEPEPVVAFQQHDHRKHRRRAGLLPAGLVARDELVVELPREQLLPDTPQES